MNLVASASVASSAIPSVAIAVVSIPMAGLEGELIPGRDATLVPCSGARVEMRAAENHDPSKSKKPAHDLPRLAHQQDISRMAADRRQRRSNPRTRWRSTSPIVNADFMLKG
jgi:hypothetical protein